MKLDYDKLIMDRKGTSQNNYSCPQYLSTQSIVKLFEEAGIAPEPKAVGVLGDMLENFALSILDGHQKETISVEELKSQLRRSIK